jgi:hypothetical protein
MANNYKVIESYNRADLESAVAYDLRNGWQLAGGVSITKYEIGILYAQAMIK